MQQLDTYGRHMQDLRISVTDRCNFRCTYCMPSEIFDNNFQFIPHERILRFEEITRLARISVGLGVRKLRITGGEPLVRKDIDQLITQLAQLSDVNDVAMTTNGFLLAKMAQKLKDSGLRRVTVSLDSTDNEVFRRMNGNRADIAPVLEGIRAAERAGLLPIKINAVIQKGMNDHGVIDLARFCKDHGYILRLIEFMDVGTRNCWKLDRVVTAQEMTEKINAVLPLEPIERINSGEVAQRYRYRDGSGELGIIASVTMPFCGNCTRLRLSAEGKLYTCLFAQDGISLRDQLRSGMSDEGISGILSDIWKLRSDHYSELRTETSATNQRVEMHYIGG